MSSSSSAVEATWSPFPGVSLEIDGSEFFTKIFQPQSEQNHTSVELSKYLQITDCKEI
jgi:hypothetical protein